MIYIVIVLAIIILEWFIKEHIEQKHQLGSKKPILNGKLILRKYHNKGAFLDAGEKHSRFVAVLSLGLTVTMTVLFILTLTKKGPAGLKAGLALMLGGAFSNTYDRMKRHYVVDYISFGFHNQKLAGIVYNISDFSIMVGALITVLFWSK